MAYTSVIEFLKRGLPHCHLLFVFELANKPLDLDAIDSIASAEISNLVAFPELQTRLRCSWSKVHEGHQTCLDRAWSTESRNFSKLLCGKTRVYGNSFPTYRMRNMHRTLKEGTIVDDRWVVLYNPYSLCRYDAHINVEICASLKAYKYIFKYIFKGPDCTVIHG